MTTTTKLGKMLENGKLVLTVRTESQSWTTTSSLSKRAALTTRSFIIHRLEP